MHIDRTAGNTQFTLFDESWNNLEEVNGIATIN
jgi:hypothetical protein